MKQSDIIAAFIDDLLDRADGMAEIGRNELALKFGCVPSQINYVITSRFTPEYGYLVESRRGGGGYIRITKVKLEIQSQLMHIINSIGVSLDEHSANIFIKNMVMDGVIKSDTGELIRIALSNKCYSDVPTNVRDRLRATLIKNMLLHIVN